MPRAITLMDVAHAAGVSRATVSLVLRNSPRVAEETRARVIEAAGRLGYVYDRSAARLRGQRSGIVGLLVSDLANPFIAESVAGVEAELGLAGYAVLLGHTFEDLDRQGSLLRVMLEHRVDGILLTPARGSDAAILDPVKTSRVPIVLTTRELVGAGVDYVGSHDRSGTTLATQHLLDHGCRRLAFLGGTEGTVSRAERLAGFRETLRAAGLDADVPSPPCENTRRDAYEICQKLFESYRPDGIICHNDLVAFGALLALQHNDLRVGVDCRLTGHDDVEEAAMTLPALTTVSTEPRAFGRRAAKVLLRRFEDPERAAERFMSPLRLAVRGSCGCPQ